MKGGGGVGFRKETTRPERVGVEEPGRGLTFADDFLVLAEENGCDSQSHLQLTVIAQDALGPREEDLPKRYRPDNGDERMAFTEPCHEIFALSSVSGLGSVA